MVEITNLKFDNEFISLELFFDHCFQRDILNGTVSIEEEEFMYEQQKIFRKMNMKMEMGQKLLPQLQ